MAESGKRQRRLSDLARRFPEEAPVATRMAERSERHTGASHASDTTFAVLGARGDIPPDALAILDASQPSAGRPAPDRLNAVV